MQIDIYKAFKAALDARKDRTMEKIPVQYLEQAKEFEAISTFETLSPWAQASVLILRLADRLNEVEWELRATKQALARETELLIEAKRKSGNIQRVSSGS